MERVFLKKASIFLLVCFLSSLFTGCMRQEAKLNPQNRIFKEEPVISVYMHETGKVKKMKLEEYLLGVVAAEMNPKWPVEALAAQAILARTFTLAKMAQGGVKQRGTDASTDIEEFQAWDGSKVNDQVRKAVQMTRGMVATYNGEYINAWFHSYSGGKTATAKEGLNYKKPEPPYIKVVDDIDIRKFADPEVVTWTARIPQKEVANFAAKVSGKEVESVQNIKIAKRGPSGRTVTLLVNGIPVNGPELRIAIGGERIRSMLLTEVRLQGGDVVFKGHGYGHGVGMSQWGAYGMAKAGKNPTEIVQYYFKGIQIDKAWK